jgi:hypothetical protein
VEPLLDESGGMVPGQMLLNVLTRGRSTTPGFLGASDDTAKQFDEGLPVGLGQPGVPFPESIDAFGL